jgi:hypothetical protein
MRALTQSLYKHILQHAKNREVEHETEIKNGTLNKMDVTYNLGFAHGVKYVLDSMREVDRYLAILINAGNDINGNPRKAYIIIDTVYNMIVNVIDVGYKGNSILTDEIIRLNNLYNKEFLNGTTYENIGEIWKSVSVSGKEYKALLKFGEDVRKELS